MIDLSGAGGLVAAAWRADRTYLIDLAYRMLGDIGAAEDVVQEAFLRLDLVEPGEVRDPRGWLTVVTSRLCLDRIRSAHNRRERPSDTAWLDSALSLGRQTVVDPADRVTLDEEVSEALLILLQRLSPAERVSFVLHDVFQLPFDQVAEILGKPSATCRQLAKRARVKVAGGPPTTKRGRWPSTSCTRSPRPSSPLAPTATSKRSPLCCTMRSGAWPTSPPAIRRSSGRAAAASRSSAAPTASPGRCCASSAATSPSSAHPPRRALPSWRFCNGGRTQPSPPRWTAGC